MTQDRQDEWFVDIEHMAAADNAVGLAATQCRLLVLILHRLEADAAPKGEAARALAVSMRGKS